MGGVRLGFFRTADVMALWRSQTGAMAIALLGVTGIAAAPVEACPPAATEARAVTGVAGGNAVRLDDGTELRLSGVLVPSARDLPAPPEDWPLATQAEAALQRLLTGRTIILAEVGTFRDRYGRRVGHAATAHGTWVQSALVEDGMARVAPVPGETDCARELFAREAVARARGAGLWSNPAYAVRPARHTRTLGRLTGTFQIVEGWVADVGVTRGEVFLNFGRNWRWDFTAAVDVRRLPDRDAAVARLRQFKGRLVRVRGYIERRNGPFIALASPEAIEEVPEGFASGR